MESNKEKEVIEIEKKMRELNISRYRLSKLSGVPESTLQRVFAEGWGEQIRTLNKIKKALGIKK